MNELSALISTLASNTTLTLEKEKTYHVCQDNSFSLVGFFCTNTATRRENPNGKREAAIFLQNKHDIVIDGNGACILVHGKMTPFVFDRCENITVRNLTVEYARPTMTEFTVLRNENGACDLKINEDCLFAIHQKTLFWIGERDSAGHPYWKEKLGDPHQQTRIFDPKTGLSHIVLRSNLAYKNIQQLDKHTVRIFFKNKNPDFLPGCVVQTRSIVRDQSGSLLQRCKNSVFENVRIRFMHGLGMTAQFCDTVTYRSCDFTPADGRTVASTADFFHFSGCKGLITIEDCSAQGAHDDYVNIHGTYLQVVKINRRKKQIRVRFMHPETWGLQAFEIGDNLEFIRWNTLQPYAQTQVAAYKKCSKTDILLTLNTPVPDGIKVRRDVIENITWTPDAHIQNCRFGPTAGRGILSTTRGEVLIENNLFDRLSGEALSVSGDCHSWYESGATTRVTFRKNRVIHCGYGTDAWHSACIRYHPVVYNGHPECYVHGSLILADNHFEKPPYDRHKIALSHLRNFFLYGNYYDKKPYLETENVGTGYRESKEYMDCFDW